VKTKGKTPHPVHINRKNTIKEAFNTKNWRHIKRLSNKDFGKHFMGQGTYYFSGNGSRLAPETLANIDIDCHKSGTLEGAIAFAQHLRDHHFPNLYFEMSTNGNGVHGYLRILKPLMIDKEVNEALDRLEIKLKHILASQAFDVEGVEVKGHCPVIGWAARRGKVETFRSGRLAKHPREALRFEELKNTTQVRAFDLLRLPMPVQAQQKIKDRRPPSSISGCVVSEGEIAKTRTSYLRLAHILLDNHRLSTSTKAVVEAEDIAVFIMFLKFFTLNMNADGSLPWARFSGLWDAVHKTGDIDRACQSNRFAVIRNYLTSLGLIEWTDNTYKVGVVKDGVKRGGKACKWKASQVLMNLIEKIEGIGSEEALPSAGQQDAEVERASLLITNITTIITNLHRKTFLETIRPVEIYDSPPLIYLPDDIGKYLTPLEEIWTVAV
jgi:hypothetical protein